MGFDKNIDKDFLEEQLDLLDARILKIDQEHGDMLANINDSLKMLHNTLNEISSISGKKNNNVININNLKDDGITKELEVLEAKLKAAIENNLRKGLSSGCGAVPPLKYKIALLKDPSHKSNTEASLSRRRNIRRYKTRSKDSTQGLYYQIKSLAMNEIVEFPTNQIQKIRYAVHKGNNEYGTNFKIMCRKNWDEQDKSFVIRIK